MARMERRMVEARMRAREGMEDEVGGVEVVFPVGVESFAVWVESFSVEVESVGAIACINLHLVPYSTTIPRTTSTYL